MRSCYTAGKILTLFTDNIYSKVDTMKSSLSRRFLGLREAFSLIVCI